MLNAQFMSVHLLAGQSCLKYLKNWEKVFSLNMVSYDIFKEPRDFWTLSTARTVLIAIAADWVTRVTQICIISLMNLDPNWWL